VVRANGGSYAVVVSNGSGSVTSLVATLTYLDTPPVANPSTYGRPAGLPLNILVPGSLSTNWSDVDGDPPALTGGISSTNGASVSYDSTYVHYTNANDVADAIDYTIGDGFGGIAADQFRCRDSRQRRWQCDAQLCRCFQLHVSSGKDGRSDAAGGLDGDQHQHRGRRRLVAIHRHPGNKLSAAILSRGISAISRGHQFEAKPRHGLTVRLV